MNWFINLLRILQAQKMADNETPDVGTPSTPPTCAPKPEPSDTFGLLDDLLFLLFLMPMVGVFIPQVRDNIKAGFDVLSTMPSWFSLVIMLGVISIFGLRKQLTEILANVVNFGKK